MASPAAASPARRPADRVLLTGATGFVGRHLFPHLKSLGLEVDSSAVRLPDRHGVAGLLAASKPRLVIHLAAVSFLPAAERDPALATEVNVRGTLSVLEALRDADPAGEVGMVFVSTGHVYRPSGAMPLDEESPLDPPTAYGRSKLSAELLCRTWCESTPRRPLWVFRPFNHTGPGQRPDFAAPSFARQVALLEAGRAEPVLHTGALAVRRDFSDVRDVVRAYGLAAAGRLEPGTYNLASGRSTSLLDIAQHYLRRSRVPFEIRERAEPGRAGEVREVVGSAERIRKGCGWRAEIPLEKTLDDLLDEWRAEAARLPAAAHQRAGKGEP